MGKCTLIVFAALWLAACDQEPPKKTVWDEQLNTMDKARDAEQQIQDAAEQQRQAIEQQTQQ